MHRDFSIEPPRRRFSVGASARFFYLGEAIARVYEPTQTQLSDLDRAYQSTGEYLVTCPEFDGLLYLGACNDLRADLPPRTVFDDPTYRAELDRRFRATRHHPFDPDEFYSVTSSLFGRC